MREPQHDWLPEAKRLCMIAIAVTVVFGLTPLDIIAARAFYHAQGPDHWPLASHLPWSALYRLAPYITASLLLIGVLWLVMGHVRRRESWRENGIFLIFCIVIGPGLIVNAVFKDHWNRPRPREVVQFGGALHYTPAPWRGEGGSSFPCGHCSVGFLYASGWWIWKRRRPGWARASLALGLTVGTALGLGRMAAGAHFLSDVVWSALFALGLAHILYHIRQLTVLDDAIKGTSGRWPGWIRGNQTTTALALLGAAFVLLALFVAPHGKPFSTQIDLALLRRPPQVLEISAPRADIDIVIGDFQTPQIHAAGELHGFGWPGSRLETSVAWHDLPDPSLSFRIEEQGWITDLSAWATLIVPPSGLQRIVVRLQQGNIHVTDTTRMGVVRSGLLQLDLHTDSGSVQRPEDVQPRL